MERHGPSLAASTAPYAAGVTDVVVVGGGTAGCVLAARLSEDPERRVCLLEAGPDYGALDAGRWPTDILDAGAIAETHDWGPGGEDGRTLGARILGGSSACNACMIVEGSPADYDEWGSEWSFKRFAPFLGRAREALGTAPANTEHPAPFHLAFIEAAHAVGLADAAPFPANVVGGRRWNAALAYLEPARGRPNLEIVGDTLVDRVELDGSRATGIVCADGRRFEAETVILAAGAYFSPAILLRSRIGPDCELRLPVGERLLDHHGTSMAWEPTERLETETAAHVGEHHLFEAHSVVKAASSTCPPGSWDIHILPWLYPGEDAGRFHVSAPLFHMKPLSAGRLSLRSTDPAVPPLVERGFLSRAEDLSTIVEAIEMVRTIAAAAPLTELLGAELRPGQVEPDAYVRATMRNYFHPAGTCPLGEVVDTDCRVLGVEGLLVADASIMPTIPRANTNLTTAAIAERVASTFH
jgi:choline dehydrogenase